MPDQIKEIELLEETILAARATEITVRQKESGEETAGSAALWRELPVTPRKSGAET